MLRVALTLWMSQCAAACRASARAPWRASQAVMKCWDASPTAQSGRTRSKMPCCGHGRAIGMFLLHVELPLTFKAPSLGCTHEACNHAEAACICSLWHKPCA